jgi:hypothetical protein
MRDPMKNVKSEDLRMLHRMADGELHDLAPGELAAFERRLLAEPALTEAMEQLRSLRSMFTAGRRAPSPVPPIGFTDGVLAAVRQQALAGAATSGGRTGGAPDRTVWTCRRILLLAAAITAIALLLHTWILTSREPEHLQAVPTEMKKEMDRLDELIRTEAGRPGGQRR